MQRPEIRRPIRVQIVPEDSGPARREEREVESREDGRTAVRVVSHVDHEGRQAVGFKVRVFSLVHVVQMRCIETAYAVVVNLQSLRFIFQGHEGDDA